MSNRAQQQSQHSKPGTSNGGGLNENDFENGGNCNLDRRVCDVVVVWLV
jgi:hypothetical protein